MLVRMTHDNDGSLVALPHIPDFVASLSGFSDLSRADWVKQVKDLRRMQWDQLQALTLSEINEISGTELSLELTARVDAIMLAAWERACLAANCPKNLGNLIALGGCGRAECNPNSDLDALVFYDGDKIPESLAKARELLQPLLWDVGFETCVHIDCRPGLEGRLAQDCVTATSVIEWRPLAMTDGETLAFAHLVERFRQRNLGSFLRYKLEELAQRRQKSGGSHLVLEPNLKTGPGCLRDVQLLRSIAFMCTGHRGLMPLLDLGGIDWSDVTQVQSTNDRLLLIRCLQHFHHHKRADALLLADQVRVATELGFVDDVALSAVERMMKTLYAEIDHIQQMVRLAISRAQALGHLGKRKNLFLSRRKMSNGFVSIDSLVYATDQANLGAPAWLERLLIAAHEAQRKDRRLSYELQRECRRYAEFISWDDRRDPKLVQPFLAILATPGKRQDILKDLRSAGVLGGFLPEFGQITAHMQFDAYHHYTVDAHTLMALGCLDQLELGPQKATLPEAQRPLRGLPEALKRITRRDLLALGILLHDVGKYLGGGHVRRGAMMAQDVAHRFGLSTHDADLVHFLVEGHLLLSDSSRTRDIHDPVFVTSLAERVATQERLDYLYVLTWADMYAVAPGIPAQWQAEILAELVLNLGAILTGQPLKQEADWKGLIARTGLSTDDAAALLASLPAEFRTNRDVQGIELTLTALITARSAPDGFGFRRLETSCGIRLGLALRDRPQLLADIAAVLSAHALDIRDCRIWQSPDGFAMQNITTVPVSPARWTEEDAWKRLEKDLRQAVLPGFDAKAFLAKRRRPIGLKTADSGPIKPEIRLEQGTGERHTVLDVRAKDRPGLLSDLTRTIGQAGLNIEYACISTLGDMAVDVFYLSLGGHKLPDAKARELRELIAQALGENRTAS